MRRSALLRAAFPVLICLAASLWLLWFFLAISSLLKGVLTLLVSLIALRVIYRRYHHAFPAKQQADHELDPPEGFSGPVLLVCGDVSDTMFASSPCRTVAHGCYLQVGSTAQLIHRANKLLAREPQMAGQLVVMFRCLPDSHQDEGQLRASLKTLRQQIKQIKALSGYLPPVVLAGEFSMPETPWFVFLNKKSLVCPADEPAQLLDEWCRLPENASRLPFLSQALAMLQQVMIDELTKTDRLYPPVMPVAVTLRGGAIATQSESLWSQWLFRRSRLTPAPLSSRAYSSVWHFADPLLPLLASCARPLQGGKTGRKVVIVLLFCALAAIALSVQHNQSLIRAIGADLQRWQAIPSANSGAKIQALHALQRDALLLERWQRQGEPQRYGLGLYPGERLWLNVQQAIDRYVPPPLPRQEIKPEAPTAPKIVRLDSMSLFDSGKASLKSGSTKMLVNSLVGIKARPGWLIVIAGHTDNTGNAKLNQTLSLKRAEAVRDWMRDTGDLPESCFAVQGYGDSRPVADNGTAEGRARNRRVEISLVPQADACRLPDIPQASSEDDVNNNETE